ncbi:2-iminoacetate synthase ThiH [Veillonella sp. VA142]|uniref:2-iminoacetate synthase ThiH n=1 Tax=Veillonella sp. VA142 TaxID=741834 RepID=UPI00197DF5F9|nr:2-iminoacetate synthase ThiH [Veillonella sp. VA142]
MDQIESPILETVLREREQYTYDHYTADDVRRVLQEDTIDIEGLKILLSPAAESFLEDLAKKAKAVRTRYFGNSVYLFTPLYISNYCDNLCVYCGFNCKNQIHRAKLDEEGIEEELKNIAKTGLQDILILTGESERHSPISYIGRACELAKKYFKVVGVEIYPANVDDYTYLRECGCDYVTVFQETYNWENYKTLHLLGNKSIFPYRLETQERALRGGMRGVGLAALLGLDDFRKDAFATALHAHLLQRAYPHGEISISCPRLRPIVNDETINAGDVGEAQLLQVILAYRLFLPYANITISTRETARFRNGVLPLAATKMSAGVSTGIGEHSSEKKQQEEGDAQFEIADSRTVAEAMEDVKALGMQVVMSDYIDVLYKEK